MTIPHEADYWRKSSYSAEGSSACVMVRGDLRAVGDSKKPDGPVLEGVNVQLMATMLRRG